MSLIVLESRIPVNYSSWLSIENKKQLSNIYNQFNKAFTEEIRNVEKINNFFCCAVNRNYNYSLYSEYFSGCEHLISLTLTQGNILETPEFKAEKLWIIVQTFDTALGKKEYSTSDENERINNALHNIEAHTNIPPFFELCAKVYQNRTGKIHISRALFPKDIDKSHIVCYGDGTFKFDFLREIKK